MATIPQHEAYLQYGYASGKRYCNGMKKRIKAFTSIQDRHDDDDDGDNAGNRDWVLYLYKKKSENSQDSHIFHWRAKKRKKNCRTLFPSFHRWYELVV